MNKSHIFNKSDIYTAIQEQYHDINWERFEEIDRALNWELWHGPLPSEYWTEVEPLEHYQWPGWVKASDDLVEILEPLPHKLWGDEDGCVYDKNPEDFELYWYTTCKYCECVLHRDNNSWVDDTDGDCCSGNDDLENENEPHVSSENFEWCGPEFEEFDPRQILCHVETYRQCF